MHGAHVGGNDNAIPHYGDECIHKGSASEGEDKYETLNELNMMEHDNIETKCKNQKFCFVLQA